MESFFKSVSTATAPKERKDKKDSESVQPETPCERDCKKEQKALAACMDIIRSDEDASSACLSPAVAAWTKCCGEANIRAQEQGD